MVQELYCAVAASVVMVTRRRQVWSVDGQLVREMLFEDVIYAVCFANERADLLVGFGDNIQCVPLYSQLIVDDRLMALRCGAMMARTSDLPTAQSDRLVAQMPILLVTKCRRFSVLTYLQTCCRPL